MNVLVADDDPNVRSALLQLLSQEAYVNGVEDTPSADEMIRIAALNKPGVVLLDVDLPGLRPDMVDAVRARSPGVRIIGMSSRRDANHMLKANLDGLIDKMYGAADLRGALSGSKKPDARSATMNR